MKNILVIYSSPNKVSISQKLAEVFIEEHTKVNPECNFIFKDLNTFGEDANLFTGNIGPDNFWKDSDELIEELKNVDGIILTAPMINFNYTSILKNYLDKILVAGKSFKYKYDGSGSEGTLNHLKVQIITTQGAPTGWYPFANIAGNLEGTFNFIGAEVVRPIVLDGTKAFFNQGKTIDELISTKFEEIKNAAINF